MSQRDIGFLLIGMVIGLALATLPLLAWVWAAHMFIVGVRSWPKTLAALSLPLLLLISGVHLVRSGRGRT
jgi:hypothetical protein